VDVARCKIHRLASKIGVALLLLPPAAFAADQFSVTLGPPTTVPIPKNPVYYYANDSHFPFLPNSNGTANITFWVDGINFRSQGRSLETMQPIDPTNSVLSGTAGQFDNGGAWLLNAIRRPDGVIVGFYHSEDHSCKPYTEWNATGVALSTNDGASFMKLGLIIGSPNPCTRNGGIAANTVIWDHLQNRWLAWGGANAFISTDRDAAPGTWRGYDITGNFTVPMPCPQPSQLGKLPGLDGHCSSQSATWNAYVHRYLMIFTRWGDPAHVYMQTSTNGIAWEPATTILTMPPGESVTYPQIIGTTSEWSEQDAWLVYDRSPSTAPGRSRDLLQRRLHINTIIP
jgi:hypothetical protein